MRAAGIEMSCGSRRVRELPIRMTVTTGLVLGLSIVSNLLLDPRLAGVLAAFPARPCVLAAMAHRSGGPAAAIELVRGLVVRAGSDHAAVPRAGRLIQRVGVSSS
jgi:hypothetical protein